MRGGTNPSEAGPLYRDALLSYLPQPLNYNYNYNYNCNYNCDYNCNYLTQRRRGTQRGPGGAEGFMPHEPGRIFWGLPLGTPPGAGEAAREASQWRPERLPPKNPGPWRAES